MPLHMKHDPQETRSTTILRHVQAYLLRTSVSEQSYAEEVRRVYHERTPDPKARTLQFHGGGDAYEDMKANGQLVGRILSRAVRMPVDLEESLVLALPQERQRACWVELAARVGRMSIAHPEDGVSGVAEDLGRLTSDVGDLLMALSPLLADLKIDHHDDLSDLKLARTRARQLSSSVHVIIEQLSEAISEKQDSVPVLRSVCRETGSDGRARS